MPVHSQLGWKKETTFGTAVTVDRFLEFTSESITAKRGRLMSTGIRSTGWVQRKALTVPYVYGAEGSVQFDVQSRNFANWLELLLGTVSTSGPAESVVYTHTGTFGDLRGKSWTMQVNRRDQTNTNRAFTWAGCKAKGFTLSCDVEGILTCEIDVDANSETTATALATASYPSSPELLAFVGGSVSIDGSDVPVKDVTISVDNGLQTDRLRLRNSTTPLEPLHESKRLVEAEFTLDFDGLTQYDRTVANTISGATASFVATWAGSIIGTSLRNQVRVTIDQLLFDEGDVSVTDESPLELKVKGQALFDTSEPFSIAVQTLESTP